MYALANNVVPGRKRGREEDEESTIEGFFEHRAKRTLTLRQSPEIKRQRLSSINNTNTHSAPQSPSVADITPCHSDSEDIPRIYDQKSAFSPWSSSPALSNLTSSQPSPSYVNSQSMSDAPFMSDEMDTTDLHLQPGSFHTDTSTTISGRLPTPINAQFSRQLPAHFSHSMTLSSSAWSSSTSLDESRRLPSPISEGETTPNVDKSITSQPNEPIQEDTQMEMDTGVVEEKLTPKRGHARSKHSLRNWTGFSPEAGGVKRFSMGYKADCEKCRMRVPGHFSHIITYPNGYD